MRTGLKIVLLLLVVGLYNCQGNNPKTTSKKEKLVEIKNGVYTEYYPGRKSIKFQGGMDSNELRDGRWYYFDEKGTELSMTEYIHGKKEGVTFVRYPNGNMRYLGEYSDDKPVGKWKTFSEDGKLESEHDYGTIAD